MDEVIRLEMTINTLDECLFKAKDVEMVWEILLEIEEIENKIYSIIFWQW